MASQAAYFGASPPPPIKKTNTPSSTTTESSSSKTKGGIKTITTKYVTTSREPTSAPDKDTSILNQEKREYNDGTTDDVTLTRKVLGGMQYDIETIVRVQNVDVGSKKTKTTYSTPYQELDPVTGKPINAFKPATHTGAQHEKTPEGLAEQIGRRAPPVTNLSHNAVPVTTGPGAASSAAAGSSSARAGGSGGGSSAVTSSEVGSLSAAAMASSAAASGTTAASTPAETATAPATSTGASGSSPNPTTTPGQSGSTPAPGEGTTTTTTTVVEEGGGCCVIL